MTYSSYCFFLGFSSGTEEEK